MTHQLGYEKQRERAYAWAGHLKEYVALESKESEPTPEREDNPGKEGKEAMEDTPSSLKPDDGKKTTGTSCANGRSQKVEARSVEGCRVTFLPGEGQTALIGHASMQNCDWSGLALAWSRASR